jgi:hypothetical protein
MALLFLDSCDLYATREQIARRWEPNGTSSSFLNVSATAGRWGGRAIQLVSSGTGRIIRPIPPRQTVILAFAARFTRDGSPVNQAFITLYDPTWTQIVIAIDFVEGRYRCYRGWFDVEITQSAVDFAAVAKEQYHWFELKVTIDATSGVVELRRNGVVLLTFAGNTKGAPTDDITRVQLRSMNQNSSNRIDVWLDDIVIADDLGGQNDDFLGDLRISTLVPTADTAQKAWTPSSGSDNFSRINEIPPDDDTSWVASATPGDRDLYTMAPLGMTPLAIKGLQQTAVARKDDAGERALSLVLKSGTEVAVASPAVLGSSYAFIEAIHEQDPATGEAWNPAAVDAVQAGMEVAP